MDQQPRLAQFGIAATNTAAMVAFYRSVLGAVLQPSGPAGTPIYRGTLAGYPFFICPNEIAEVRAEQARHQLRFAVPDVRDTLARAEAAGGPIHPASKPEDAVVAIVDPDGNSVEISQL